MTWKYSLLQSSEFKRSRSFNNFGQRSLGWNNFKYFLTETIIPVCIANHHFDTVTLFLQTIGKFIVKTNVPNFISY